MLWEGRKGRVWNILLLLHRTPAELAYNELCFVCAECFNTRVYGLIITQKGSWHD